MATVLGFARKRDLVYFIYFCVSIPTMFLMDLQAIYPPSLVPAFMTNMKNFYVETYHDQYFVEPTPVWFSVFIWLEIWVQFPVAVWVLGGLRRDDSKLPVVLLPFATLVFVTTLTCIVDTWSWEVPTEQKIALSQLYGPYLMLAAYMGVDMILRLLDVIKKAGVGRKKDPKKLR